MTLLGRTLSPEELSAAGLAVMAADAESEARALARWGDDPEYQDYLRRTPRLAPWSKP